MSLKFINNTQKRDNNGHRFSLFSCSICGNEKEIRNDAAKVSNSCGCLCGGKPRHGMSNTKTYKAWSSAKERCSSKTHPNYKSYGGRGVSMCDDWSASFENFLKDMGVAPKGLTLERRDVNGNYEKDNCVWATCSEQMRNRRDSYVWTVKGIIFQTSLEAEIYFNVARSTIRIWVLGRKRNGKFYEPLKNCTRRKKYGHELNMLNELMKLK